jgi:hypothetical protein
MILLAGIVSPPVAGTVVTLRFEICLLPSTGCQAKGNDNSKLYNLQGSADENRTDLP